MTEAQLIIEAKKAREMSYSPYSNFKVGAALLTESGKVYHGCNIENAAYSPTNCAERLAFFKAVSDGERQFKMMAVIGGFADSIDSECYPCGVCRQVMHEFCSESFKVVLSGTDGKITTLTLSELLPHSFGL